MYFIERLSSQILAEASEGKVSEIQLLRCGEWQHPKYGPLRITPKTLHDIKNNYEKNVRGVELAIDTEHKPEEGSNAWVKKLSIKDKGNTLWAEVNWTDLGKKNVGGGIYRYTSAEFVPEYKDTETGRTFNNVMMGAALTNRPFIKHMTPVALSENVMAIQEMDMQFNWNSDKEEFRMKTEEIQRLKETFTDIKLLAKNIGESNEINRATTLADLNAACTALSELVNAGQQEQALFLSEKMVSENPEVMKLKEEFMAEKRLRLAEERAMTVRLAEDFANTMLLDANKHGRILPKQKDPLVRLLSDLDSEHADMVRALVENIPAVIDYNERGEAGGQAVTKTDDADQKVLLSEVDEFVKGGMTLRQATLELNKIHNMTE